MKNISENELQELAKARLSEKRYLHTMAVARLASELAERYSVSTEDANSSALLHDITKEENKAWHLKMLHSEMLHSEMLHSEMLHSEMLQLQMLEKSDIMSCTAVKQSKNVYHSITGYLYARDILGLENEDILNAIRYHTTGRANMSMLEKIIFTADKVAYDRTYDGANALRRLAFTDIDGCMLQIISFTISDLVKKLSVISIETIECYNYLLGA